MHSLFKFLVAFSLCVGANADMNSYLKRTGKAFMAMTLRENTKAQLLKSGMIVEVLQESTKADAKSPNIGDTCEVTYSGTLRDGTAFDSGTTSFAPNQVIKGWTEAMQLMVEGDKWKLYIPHDLAYGERGSPPRIPPYSPLVFEIEIHKVKSGGKSATEAREMFQKALAPDANEDL